MEIVELTPELALLRFAVGQSYVWHDERGALLVDTGPPGHGAKIAAAIERLAGSRQALQQVVLTHFHGDHTGSVAELREWSDAPIVAHRLDAPIVRGEQAPPPPVLEDWERPLFEQVAEHLVGPPAPVDREVDDGDVLFADGSARVVHVPGHTEGSIAVYLPERRVLFTGDTIAEHGGTTMLGVFNSDRDRTVASVLRLAELDVDIACFGHGEPVLGDASSALRKLAAVHTGGHID